MLGTGYLLNIAKINSQREQPLCPNRKNLIVPTKQEKAPIRKNKLRENFFVPHGILVICGRNSKLFISNQN